MTSLKYPKNTQVSYMKGIIEEKRVKWSDYAPIVVSKLPYYIKAKLGAPVSSVTPRRTCGMAQVSCMRAVGKAQEIA